MVRTELFRGSVLALAVCLAACGGEANGAEGAAEAPVGAAETAAEQAPTPPVDTPAPGTGQRVDLDDIGYDRGSTDAPVLVLEFSDFGCPYCGRFALSSLPQIQEEFIDDGVVRWKYIPFVMGMFRNGAEAARAAECAAEQEPDRFWSMHDRLYTDQPEWKRTTTPRDEFIGYARELELDVDAFAACYDSSQQVRDRIDLNNTLAARLGVRATPTFFVNGVRVQGALPMEHFRLLLKGAAAQ